MSKKKILADPASRNKWILLVLILLAIFFVAMSLWQWLFPPLDFNNAPIGELEDAVKRENFWLSVIVVIAQFPIAIGCLSLWRFGKKTKKSEQYPPPGSKMPVTVRQEIGKNAKAYGFLFMFLAEVQFAVAITYAVISVYHAIWLTQVFPGNP